MSTVANKDSLAGSSPPPRGSDCQRARQEWPPPHVVRLKVLSLRRLPPRRLGAATESGCSWPERWPQRSSPVTFWCRG